MTTHQQLYLALTTLTESIRATLKSVFSINALVQLTDHSIESSPMTIESCMQTCSVVYQFQLNQQRGFVFFPDELGHWLTSELLGVPAPSEGSKLTDYVYQLLIDDVFQASELFDHIQRVDVHSIWVHPTFDQFYPMSFTVHQSRDVGIKSWCFIPKESSE